ncbi:MAG: putative viral replication protein [Cressdnaviricota sp.]|nr:MAG: putative viral replication protein [Cressdnaviricota sp.]
MAIEQYTYWSITINNPDENDYLIARTPNDKYIRSMVWTPEIGGKEGTPHIQGWVRFQRNQSQAFVRKLYPRAHLKPCKKDDYNENCFRYAQKDDGTTAGPHHIILNDPLPANDTLLYKVLDRGFNLLIERDSKLSDHLDHEGIHDVLARITLKSLYTDEVEREMITERSGLEKIFISPVYEKMKAKYWREILIRIYVSKQDASDKCTERLSQGTPEKSGGSQICEDYEESESGEDERSCESRSSSGSSSYDC